MHEMDRDLICSGFILNLLCSRPDSSDVRKEQVTRKNLVADMNLLYNDCLRSKYSSSSSLYHLLKKKKSSFEIYWINHPFAGAGDRQLV